MKYAKKLAIVPRRIKKLARGKELFQKKPLGRRWYLMSGAVTRREFSTTTSGTERERGFVGIVPSLSRTIEPQIRIIIELNRQNT